MNINGNRCFTANLKPRTPTAFSIQPENMALYTMNQRDSLGRLPNATEPISIRVQAAWEQLQDLEAISRISSGKFDMELNLPMHKATKLKDLIAKMASHHGFQVKNQRTDWGVFSAPYKFSFDGPPDRKMQLLRMIANTFEDEEFISREDIQLMKLQGLKLKNEYHKEIQLIKRRDLAPIPVNPSLKSEADMKKLLSSNIKEALKILSVNQNKVFDGPEARPNDAKIYRSCEPFIQDNPDLKETYCKHLNNCALAKSGQPRQKQQPASGQKTTR